MRGAVPEFTDQYIMVLWDQLGSGINNTKIDDSLSISSFVKMTCDLIEAIKKRFPQNKIYLFGVSWGSILAVNAANIIAVDGVFVFGQVLNHLFFNEDVLATLKKNHKISKKQYDKIERVFAKKAKDIDALKYIVKLIQKYTEGYTVKGESYKNVFRLIIQSLFSQDYQLKDFIAMFSNGTTQSNLMEILLTVDTSEELKKLETPYYIMQGTKDIVTSTKALSAFLSEIESPHIQIELVENCGHLPHDTSMEQIINTLKNILL